MRIGRTFPARPTVLHGQSATIPVQTGTVRAVTFPAANRELTPRANVTRLFKPILLPGTPATIPVPHGSVNATTRISRQQALRQHTGRYFTFKAYQGIGILAPFVPTTSPTLPMLNPLEMTEVTTPTAASTGTMRLYFKSNESLYSMDPSGVETLLAPSSGTPATPTHMNQNITVGSTYPSQMLFRQSIVMGSYSIILTAGSSLIGV